MFDRFKELFRGGAHKQQGGEAEEHEATHEEQAQIATMNQSQINAVLKQKPENNPVEADTPELAGPDRTFAADTEGVKEQIAKIPDKVFKMMKNAALANPAAAKEVKGAKMRNNFYGSRIHREYGAAVAELTGGRITPEEAMRMNPSGGIAGPGLFGIAFDSGPLHRHAIWHDACGFLLTAFNIGRGYGGDTPDSPLSGQFQGIAREVRRPAALPDWERVGTPATTRQDEANDNHNG